MVSLCDTEKYHPSLNNVIDKSKVCNKYKTICDIEFG